MKTEQKIVKVKFLKLPAELLHVHDGKVCEPDTELELPEDVAEFVIKNKKATAVTAAAAAAKN
jgi:hypothetical protein